MRKVKLYVHDYLGCLCLVAPVKIENNSYVPEGFEVVYSVFDKDKLELQEMHQSPESWELIDEWEEK